MEKKLQLVTYNNKMMHLASCKVSTNPYTGKSQIPPLDRIHTLKQCRICLPDGVDDKALDEFVEGQKVLKELEKKITLDTTDEELEEITTLTMLKLVLQEHIDFDKVSAEKVHDLVNDLCKKK